MSLFGQYLVQMCRAAAGAAVLFFGIGVLAAPAFSVTVSGLYGAVVPVEGASASELEKGYADGLRKVLVRVSGSRDVLTKEGVDALLADAESLLLSYQYLRGDDGENRLKMTFGPVGVNRALASIEAPVWGANRPLTLAWIAVEDRGTRTLVTRGEEPEFWRSALLAAAEERGLPVALPESRFAGDRELLSDIWGQFVNRVRTASGPTDYDALALVRIRRTAGQWRAGWVFDGMSMDGGEQSVTADSPEALVQAMVDRWADRYASRYAVSAGEVGELPQVDIVLQGVASIADYGMASRVLEGFTPIRSVGAVRVKGEQLTLRVTFSGELDQLTEYIALDPRFVPLDREPEPVLDRESLPGQGPAEQTDVEPPAQDESAPAPAGEGEASLFSYQPIPMDDEQAELAFESLYQVLYYRWQPQPAIGNAPSR